MTSLRVTQEAALEVESATDWYESKHSGLGREFVAQVDAALLRILRNPNAHRLWRQDRDFRQAVVPRFPYVIFFRYANDEVIVMAFAHQRRRPGYWALR